MKILFVILLAVPAQASVCDYYLEQSSQLGCPQYNYLKQFGYRYCERFLDRADVFNVESQWTLGKIRSCLIDSLKTREDLTCENVAEIAWASHVPCYLNNNFCEMSLFDRYRVYWLLRDEVGTPFANEFSAEIIRVCGRLVQ